LIGDAIYAHVPEPDRRRLHGRTAEAARDRPELGGAPFLAIHYEGAGQAVEAYHAALAGARRAVALSSHAEALALFEMARRTAPRQLAPLERGALEEAYAGAAAATDDNATADKAYG